MSDATAIVGVINPITKVANVYYLNESCQVDLHDLGGPIDAKTIIPVGYIRRPSSFASVARNDGMTGIYGITNHATYAGETDDQKKNLNVSLVSPIFRPTPCITRTGCIASATNGKKAWLYYLNIKQEIMEYQVDSANPAVKLMKNAPALDSSTYLTAFCDRDGHRHIYYRLESGDISSFNQDDGSTYPVLDESDILPNSPIAACMVVATTDGKEQGTAYIYYASRSKKLRRTSSTSNGHWGSVVTFKDVDVGASTQFSVINHKGTTKNTLFYHDGKEMITLDDDVSLPVE